MLNPFFNYPKYFEKYERLWCKECDYISVPTIASYKGYYQEYWEKIKVIPQGFDFSKTPIAKYKKTTFLHLYLSGLYIQGSETLIHLWTIC